MLQNLRRPAPWVALILFMLTLVGVAAAQAQQPASAKKAIDFTLTDTTGKQVKLSTYRGKVVLIAVWATWSGDCTREIPEWIALQKQATANNKPVQVLGIVVDGNMSSIAAFVKKTPCNFPVLRAETTAMQNFGIIPLLPTTFVITDAGVNAEHLAGVQTASTLLTEVQKYLSKTVATTALDTEEQAFVTLINTYRQQHGLGPLTISTKLQNSATWMSADLAKKNYFQHTDSLGRTVDVRLHAFGYTYNTSLGENIATRNATAAATFTQWKNSPEHNANMLTGSYKVMGIARANQAGSLYGWYWVNDFGGFDDTTTH